MKKYVAEAIGTYTLVFAGTGAVVVDGVADGALGLVGIAMVFSLVIMAMIYSIGDISGAHINPAVSIAACVRGGFPVAEVVPYLVAQCAGALAASASLKLLFPEVASLGATLPSGTIGQSLAFEMILTFFLLFVVFGVTAPGKAEALLAGLAIGGTVGFEVFLGGPISGASMNPARSIGPAVMGGQMQHLWVYLVGPIAGAVLAALVTRYLRSDGEKAGG